MKPFFNIKFACCDSNANCYVCHLCRLDIEHYNSSVKKIEELKNKLHAAKQFYVTHSAKRGLLVSPASAKTEPAYKKKLIFSNPFEDEEWETLQDIVPLLPEEPSVCESLESEAVESLLTTNLPTSPVRSTSVKTARLPLLMRRKGGYRDQNITYASVDIARQLRHDIVPTPANGSIAKALKILAERFPEQFKKVLAQQVRKECNEVKVKGKGEILSRSTPEDCLNFDFCKISETVEQVSPAKPLNFQRP